LTQAGSIESCQTEAPVWFEELDDRISLVLALVSLPKTYKVLYSNSLEMLMPRHMAARRLACYPCRRSILLPIQPVRALFMF
jgi:hypothetical protein